MIKKILTALICTSPFLYANFAFAVATGIELSSVDIPMDGATISLGGLEDIEIKKTSLCDEQTQDCPDPAYSYYFEPDIPIDKNIMGTAVFKTKEGGRSSTFTSQPFGFITISPAIIDADNIVTAWIDPLGRRYDLAYDDLGNIISSTDEAGLSTTYQYDSLNRRISETDPGGNRVQSEYDGLNRKVAEISSDNARTTIGHNIDMREISLTSDESGTTVYRYDPQGRIISRTATTGNDTTYEYDTPNKTITELSSDGTASKTLYNAAGQKITETAIVTNWSPYDPINIGPKSKVGTESVGSKVAKAAAGKVLGSLLGGFGGGPKKSRGPKTKRDPARRADKTELYDEETDTKIELRPKWVKDKLLISVNIKDSDDKATFQHIFLVDQNGNILGPQSVDLYKIWVKHTLTVSWTQSTYVDGNLVSQSSGGWSESWVTDLGTFGAGQNPLSDMPGIWQQLGYDRAHAGARKVGATFNISPTMFDQLGPVSIVTHISRPKLDPVSTIPFVGKLFRNGEDDFKIDQIIQVTPSIITSDS